MSEDISGKFPFRIIQNHSDLCRYVCAAKRHYFTHNYISYNIPWKSRFVNEFFNIFAIFLSFQALIRNSAAQTPFFVHFGTIRGDIYPVSAQTPRFRAQIPISRLGSPYKVKTKASLKEKNEKHALHPASTGTGFTPATHLYAGVQTMRARICSAFSCDMFARVV